MQELRRISIIWGLLLFLVFSVLTFFGLKWKKEYEPYIDLEKKIVSTTKSYYESAHAYPNPNEEVKITLEELQQNNLLQEFSYKNDACTGYVIVKNKGVMEFKGYIKCPNYTTKNYEKNI